jgi:PAS domain S-box-containing protein
LVVVVRTATRRGPLTDLETPLGRRSSEEGPRRAEAALLSSRADLEAILGQVADGITVQDGRGSLVYANDTAARLVGFGSAEELMSTPVADVLARFEMFDEDGQPFPLERLPGRLALQGVESEQVICYRTVATGVRRWSVVRATPVFDEHGAIRYAVNAFQDVTARKQAEERLRLLAEASAVFASLDYEQTLEQIPRLVVPRLADACSVWYASDGYLHRLSTHTADPEKLEAYEAIPRKWSLTDDADTLMVSLFNAGEAFLIPELSLDVLRTAARDERDVERIERVGTRSAIVLPLVARGRNFGLLSLIGFQPNAFDEEDFALAKVLAARVAVALDRSLLYRESEQARGDLEFLAEAGQLFASSLDLDEILKRIARVIVPRVADACNIYLADGDLLTRVAFANSDEPLEAVMARMPERYDLGPSAPAVFRSIFVSGEALLASELTPELVAALEELGLDRDQFREVGSRSMMFVPFVSRGETLGVITIGAREAGRYGERDLALALELARRAATAIENARNYEQATDRAHAAQALEFVGDGVLLVDGDGVVRLWNPAAEAITGLPAGDVVGRRAADAIPGWAELEPHVPISLRPETLPLGDGELWVSISGVTFAEGTVYAFRDVTDEYAVERMKTDFISTVSHELRTPLAAIYGAAMTVRRDGPGVDERRDELIGLIGTEAERLARTINDVLWASRLDSGTLELSIESCDPAALVDRVVAARRTHLPENLRLDSDVDPETPRVAADSDKVRQVLENIVDNAVKYSPDGGTIRLSVSPNGRYVAFAIADEGLGIPPAERERIFSKFYRLDPDLTRGVGGTGLGLYISRALVQRMDGRVRVEGNAAGGSTFVVELPAASEPA